MKNILSLLFALCAFSSCSISGIPERPEKLMNRPVHLDRTRPEHWQLKNGLSVYFVPDNELPLVNGILYVPGGNYVERAEKPGVAAAVGYLLRDGGFAGMPPDKLDERLDSLAAGIQSVSGPQYGSVMFSGLSEDFQELLGHVSGIVRRPAFDEKRFALWKALSLDSIRRRRDDPSLMADLSFLSLVYGLNTPLNRFATVESVSHMTTDDLRQFWRRWIRPNGAVLAITGAIDRKTLEEALEREFGDWPVNPQPLPPAPEVTVLPEPAVYLLQRDFDQATVVLGHIGPPRLTPDRYDVTIFNRYFGYGAFGSVLFQEVRSKRGLAYDVNGGIFPAFGKGVFQIALQTRVAEAPRAIKEVLSRISLAREEEPPADRISKMKSAVERGFVFNFDTGEEIVQRASTLALWGYPADYDDTYLPSIEKVAPPGVREAAERWIYPSDIVVVVVGRVTPEALRAELGEDVKIVPLSFDEMPQIAG